MPEKTNKTKSKTIKTTINIDKKLWTDFSIKVIKTEGGRKKNQVIAEQIKKYLRGEIVV